MVTRQERSCPLITHFSNLTLQMPSNSYVDYENKLIDRNIRI